MARPRVRAIRGRAVASSVLALMILVPWAAAQAQNPGPTILDPRLALRTVVDGLVTPTSIAFLEEKYAAKIFLVGAAEIPPNPPPPPLKFDRPGVATAFGEGLKRSLPLRELTA